MLARCAGLALLTLAASLALSAQVIVHPPVATPGTGGNTFNTPADVRYPPHRDPQDRRIDMFFGDWRDSMPRSEHGSLVLRDILTHGDNYDPPQKGAVLQAANFLAYATLQPRDTTTLESMPDEQEVYYIVRGEGTVTAGGRTAPLHKDIAVFMPEHLPFQIANTGDGPLSLYVINEKAPASFVPRNDMIVTDERRVPVRYPLIPSPYTNPGASGHWSHIVRDLFSRHDGLASIGDVITVEINPLSMGEPHPHGAGHEEVWAELEGTSIAFVGTQLRLQPPGVAYMLRPDFEAIHSNINDSDKPVKFLWFSSNSNPR